MYTLKAAGAAGIIAILSSTTALYADVTADQVWEAWQKQYAAYGYTLTPAATDRSGSVLTVKDLVLGMDKTMEVDTFKQSVKTSLTIPALIFEDMGDGTVKVTVDGDITGKNSVTPSEGPAQEADITIRKSDAVAIVSGTPEAMSYAVTAPEVVVDVDSRVLADGAGAPAKVNLTMSGITGTYDVAGTTDQQIKSDLKAGGMKVVVSGADPETNSTVNMNMQFANLAMVSDFIMPAGVDTSKFAEAIGAGFGGTGTMTYGSSSYEMEAATDKGPVNLSGSAQSGKLDIKLGRDGLRYAASGADATLDVQTAQFPVPVKVQMAEGSFDLGIPVSKSDGPQPFVGKIGLVGLTVSDDLWNMFDPQQHLARDPATLIIDLAGKASLNTDLFSPEMANLQGPPGQLDSLDINQIKLTLGGADLSGTGAMTFDNAAGIPMPLGAIDLKLAGANKLMDSLVAMGLMPQDQVMFARMMLGLYTVPAGDDLLTSKIEFKEGGQILANGQRIQ